MSRPTFSLTDEQARVLRDALVPVLKNHPPGATSHRPFLRDFLRAVFVATGRTYGHAIYRRLLDVYAPDRSPSSDTLSLEKKALDAALDEEARAGRSLDTGGGEELAAVVGRAVEKALSRHAAATQQSTGAESFLRAQLDFLQARLLETEQSLHDVRSFAARQAADLQAALSVRDVLQQQVDQMQAAALAQTSRIEQLTTEITGMRTFAMRAIEASRGETRAQQERAVHLETLLKTEKEHTEVFRRLAYRSGAAIPASLQPDKN